MATKVKVSDRDRIAAKKAVEEAWRRTCMGPKDFDHYAVPCVALAIAKARQEAGTRRG